MTISAAPAPTRTPADRALVLGGGGSTGNAWLIGVLAGLAEAGLDVTAGDLTIGTSAGATAAAQLAGGRAGRSPWRPSSTPPSRRGPRRADWVGPAGDRPPGPAADHDCRVRRSRRPAAPARGRGRSTWTPPRTGPSPRSGGPPSPPGCPIGTGPNAGCSSPRSTPGPVSRSRSTGTAGSSWWTRHGPVAPAAPPLPDRRRPLPRRRVPGQRRERRPGRRIRSGAGGAHRSAVGR